MKLMLQGDGDQQPLLTFVDDCMKQPEQKALIEVQSQLCIVQDELKEFIEKFFLPCTVFSLVEMHDKFLIKNRM